MLEKYQESQVFACQILKNEINNNKISHAYLLEANGYHDAMGFALALAKTLFCVNGENVDNILLQIDSGNFPELKIIDPEGLIIKKEEIDELQIEFSKKPIYSDKKIYIINNANRLNGSSANALLKFLEEPSQNIIAILITNNVYEMMETIISRCQIISLKEEVIDLSQMELESRILYAINKSSEEIKSIFDNESLEDCLFKCIDFVNYYEKHKLDTFIYTNKMWFEYYNSKETFDIALQIMLLYYIDVLRLSCGTSVNIFFEIIDRMNVIISNNDINNISSKIKIIMNLQKRVRQNNNLNLVMDKLLIEFGRCDKIV